jgi:hypothetical protein
MSQRTAVAVLCVLLVIAGCAAPSQEPPESLDATPEPADVLRIHIASEYPQLQTEALGAAVIEVWEQLVPDGITLEQTTSPAAADLQIRFTGAIDSCGGTAAANDVYCLNDTQGTITIETRNQTQLPSITAAALGAYLDVDATAMRTQIDAVEALGYDDPWLGPGPVTVGVDAVDGRDYTPLVRDALSYWENASAAHAWYSVDFVIDNDAASPDVQVTFVNTILRCDLEGDGPVIGCADIIEPVDAPVEQARVEIALGYTNASMRETLRHEFGHIHGIDHGEAPMPLMAAVIADATRIPATDAVDRSLGWEDADLQLYVAYDSFVHQRPKIEAQTRHAIDYWEWYTRTSEKTPVNITEVDSAAEADIVVRGGALPCSTLTAGSCTTWGGSDPDRDGSFETFADQEVYIRGIPADKVGWHIGANLIYTLGGARTVQDAPEPFLRANHNQRRTWFEYYR